MASIRYYLRSLLAYLTRPSGPPLRRRLAVAWAYTKITAIERFGMSARRVKALGFVIRFPDALTLRRLFEELVLGEHYWFEPPSDRPPAIIDAGANIGFAALFFKWLFPDATIRSFEPNPDSAKYLQANIDANGLRGVTVIEIALGAERAQAELVGQDLAATLEPGPTIGGPSRTVEVKPLSDFLDDSEHVDILKLDIEGAEVVVLRELGKRLRRVDQIVLEYHRWADSEPLSALLEILEENGHSYEIRHWYRYPDGDTCMIATRGPGLTRNGSDLPT